MTADGAFMTGHDGSDGTPVAGWYPDPRDAERLRWWDGTAWTEARRDRAVLAPPTPTGRVATDPAPPTGPPPPTGQRFDPSPPIAEPTAVELEAAATEHAGRERRRRTWIPRLVILVALAAIGSSLALGGFDAGGGIAYRVTDRTVLNPLSGPVTLWVSGADGIPARARIAPDTDRPLTRMPSGRWTLDEPLRITIDAPDRDADLDVEVDLRVAGATFLNEGWNVVVELVITDTEIDVRVTQPTTRGLLLERTDAFSTALRREPRARSSATPAPVAPRPNPARGLDPDAEPAFGTVTLVAGFRDDPRTFEVVAGGSADTEGLPADCRSAAIDAEPDLRLIYSASQLSLAISAFSDTGDLMLVVQEPNGRFTCADDTVGLDPAIEFRRPSSGAYNVWVGVFDAGTARATLAISELGPYFP